MPEAESFNALGKGNGFPFCPNKVDVSGYDYWVTLGGYKKTDTGGPTQAQVDLSLKNAMQLFWNLDGWTGRIFDGSRLTSYEITSLSMKNGDGYYAQKLDGTLVDEPAFDPNDRVCYKSFKANKYNDRVGISLGGIPFRMYNGATSNEDNFVGYGFSQPISANVSTDYYILHLSPYQNETPYEDIYSGFGEDISYAEIPTNIEGVTIPAVGLIRTEYFGDSNGEIQKDDFNVYSWENLQFEQSNPYDFAFKIDSLDFYTYPA